MSFLAGGRGVLARGGREEREEEGEEVSLANSCVIQACREDAHSALLSLVTNQRLCTFS